MEKLQILGLAMTRSWYSVNMYTGYSDVASTSSELANAADLPYGFGNVCAGGV
jgi:hypothetical protein